MPFCLLPGLFFHTRYYDVLMYIVVPEDPDLRENIRLAIFKSQRIRYFFVIVYQDYCRENNAECSPVSSVRMRKTKPFS